MKKCNVIAALLLGTSLSVCNQGSLYGQSETLAYWRFEQIQHLKGDSVSLATVGTPLKATDRGPSEPQPYIFDESGKGNVIQTRGSRPSPNIFSDDVPSATINGKPNKRSLILKRGEYVVTYDRDRKSVV